MASKFTGGCLCGAVRYECVAEPIFMGNCHCRDCQKVSGGAYAPEIGLPAAALKITGTAKYHDTKADSGNTLSRGFCPECGTRLFAKTSAMPDLAMIGAGTLDNPSLYAPAMDIFTASAQHWDYMNPALAKFPKMPI
ncbi:MAG: GFA family protein [Deltaproteobacteria bacterium]|nr:GFA family protein [Deltaproteobacteria bacterium]